MSISDKTIEQLLAASEAVFAKEGYTGASLRKITNLANTNLGKR
jgi:AcrR family transcriptional regulator